MRFDSFHLLASERLYLYSQYLIEPVPPITVMARVISDSFSFVNFGDQIKSVKPTVVALAPTRSVPSLKIAPFGKNRNVKTLCEALAGYLLRRNCATGTGMISVGVIEMFCGRVCSLTSLDGSKATLFNWRSSSAVVGWFSSMSRTRLSVKSISTRIVLPSNREL